MKKTLLSLSCMLALVVAGGNVQADDNDRPNPNEMRIDRITYAGSGCPFESVAIDLAPDGKAFTVMFDKFVAEFGPGIKLSESRKNCQLNLTVHVPGGFTYAIAAVDYRGFGDIAKGATGSHLATYYFQGQQPQAQTTRVFKGPWGDDFNYRDEVGVAALIFKPCGVERSLNINAQLRVVPGTSKAGSGSFLAMDSEDGSITQKFHFAFERCRQN